MKRTVLHDTISPLAGGATMTTPPRSIQYTASGDQSIVSHILSPSESDVASLEDYDRAVEKLPLQQQQQGDGGDKKPSLEREKILRKLDGMDSTISPAAGSNTTTSAVPNNASMRTSQSELLTTHFEDEKEVDSDIVRKSASTPYRSNHTPYASMKKAPVKPVVIKSMELKQQPEEMNTINSWFNYFLGNASKESDNTDQDSTGGGFPLSCGSSQMTFPERLPAFGTSFVQIGNPEPLPPSYPQIVLESRKADARMQQWVENKFKQRSALPKDGTYQLGESKSIVVHEILRGKLDVEHRLVTGR